MCVVNYEHLDWQANNTSIWSIIHTQTLHPCNVIDSQCVIF